MPPTAVALTPLEPNLNIVNENDDDDDEGSMYSDGTVTESQIEGESLGISNPDPC